MAQLANTPRSETFLRLEARKSFSFALRLVDGDGQPLDITGSRLHFSVRRRDSDAANMIANSGSYSYPAEARQGLARFHLQASDLAHPAGEYPFAITIITNGYSSVLVSGTLEIVSNPAHNGLDETYLPGTHVSALEVSLKGQVIVVQAGDIRAPGVNVFTDSDRKKFEAIESGAEKNVHANWSAGPGTPGYIENRPLSRLVPKPRSAGQLLTSTGVADGDFGWVSLEDARITAEDLGLGQVDNTSDENKPLSSATRTALAKIQRPGTEAPGFLGTSILDFGAVGDGKTDCTAAILAARGKGTVYFPKGVYITSRRITLTSNTHFLGEKGSVIRAIPDWSDTSMMFYAAPGTTDVTMEKLDIDGSGAAKRLGLFWANNTIDFTITGCELHSLPGVFENGFAVQASGNTRLTIKNCYIHDTLSALYAYSGGDGLYLLNNRIERSNHIDVRILEENQVMVKNIVIDGNHIRGDGHRGSLLFLGASQNFKLGTSRYENVRVSNNVGIGRFRSFLSGFGNIDLFSLRGMKNATVYGNTVMGGGDLGLVIEWSEDVAVVGNVVRENEISGLVVHDSHRVSVTGNTCTNNATNTDGTMTPDAVRAGIRVMAGSTHVLVSGNTCTDSRPRAQKTQLYGVALWDGLGGALSQCKVGTNFVAENKWGGYYTDNTGFVLHDEYRVVSAKSLPLEHVPAFTKAISRTITVGLPSELMVTRSGVATLTDAVAAAAQTVTVTGAGTITPESSVVGILLDNKDVHWSRVTTVSGSTLTLETPVPSAAAAGSVLKFTVWRPVAYYPALV